MGLPFWIQIARIEGIMIGVLLWKREKRITFWEVNPLRIRWDWVSAIYSWLRTCWKDRVRLSRLKVHSLWKGLQSSGQRLRDGGDRSHTGFRLRLLSGMLRLPQEQCFNDSLLCSFWWLFQGLVIPESYQPAVLLRIAQCSSGNETGWKVLRSGCSQTDEEHLSCQYREQRRMPSIRHPEEDHGSPGDP